MIWRMVSRSITPKSWRIWLTGLPVRLNSPRTSSYWRSSMRLCSLMSESRGFVMSSAILRFPLDEVFGFGADGGGEFELLELCLDGSWVLGFGDYFFAGDHSGEVFVDEEAVESNHAIFRARLDVRLDTESLVVANERRDGRRIDHDLEDGDATRLIDARQQQLGDDGLHDR